MIVTAWKNGTAFASTSGAGYGVRLAADDRDRYFRKDWETIELELQGYAQVVKVNMAKPSFWNSRSRELIHAEIGRWLIDNGLESWQLGKPPKLALKFIGGNRFRLMKEIGNDLLAGSHNERSNREVAPGLESYDQPRST